YALPTWRIPYGERTGIRTPDTRLRRALLYPAELCTRIIGAGEGDRTLTAGLEGRNSTIELHPHGGGGWWIRTTESNANRFTVCPLWPLGKSSILELVIGIEPTTC